MENYPNIDVFTQNHIGYKTICQNNLASTATLLYEKYPDIYYLETYDNYVELVIEDWGICNQL